VRILNFGSCNMDYVYHVDHAVRPGETISAEKLDIFPGGKGLNQSVAAARAGASVWHAGCVGLEGKLLTDTLRESGVSLLLDRAEAPNGHAIIQISPDGENCIVLHRGTNGMIRKTMADGCMRHFGQDDILLLQNEINLVPYLIEKGHKLGLQVIFNAAPYDSSLKDLDLNQISYLVVNEIEAEGFFLTADPHKISAYLKKAYPKLRVVLTLGKCGCALIHANGVLSHPAYPVKAVDTTAAGDTFTGYFAAMLAAGKAPQECLRYASAAAALAVTKHGAAPSIPALDQVNTFLAEKGAAV